MNPQVNAIASRLSLRTPQRESLEILSEVCDALPLNIDKDVDACLKAVSTLYPSVTDLKRDFP